LNAALRKLEQEVEARRREILDRIGRIERSRYAAKEVSWE
jgi:hypothetical protein